MDLGFFPSSTIEERFGNLDGSIFCFISQEELEFGNGSILDFSNRKEFESEGLSWQPMFINTRIGVGKLCWIVTDWENLISD